MPKKHRIFKIAFSALALSVFSFSFASALEITTYPPILGLPSITDNSTLGDYIGYFFGMGIYLAGAIAVISLAIGAIRLIMSAGSPEANKDARDRIKNSVIGLVLTLSAFIILKTINPMLVTPVLTSLPGVEGVYYLKGSEEHPCPQSEPNTAAAIKNGYTSIKYKCSATGQGGTGPALLIWEYPNINYQGTDDKYSGVNIKRLECGQEETLSNIKSFEMDFETAGVYYFLGPNCAGFMSRATVSDEANLNPVFREKIKSVQIINDPASKLYFITILHSEPLFGGRCAGVTPGVNKKFCMNVNIPASSLSIFKWNPDQGYSGDGAIFYSRPFGYDTGSKAGYREVGDVEIGGKLEKDAKDIKFSYQGIDVPQGEKDLCKTFYDCPGSIKIKGDYKVIIWSKKDKVTDYCQIFSNDVPKLEAVLSAEGKKVDWVTIFPSK